MFKLLKKRIYNLVDICMSTFAKHVQGAVKNLTSQTFVQFVTAKNP